MNLYLFLSVIVICITIIVCYILNNFRDISDYYEYRIDHIALKKLKDNYNNTIYKYQTQVESICSVIKDLKACDIAFIRNNNKAIRTLFAIKSILYNDADVCVKLKDIDNIINNFSS